MALSKLLAASLIVSFLLLHLGEAYESQEAPQQTIEDSVNNKKIDCSGACSVRCSKASRQRMCKRACGTCCQRCNCVPPGTSGNQKLCPCYYNQTTHGGRRKCP
ncbi:hypothetical protein HN51_017865 [Arachis hypogaea]|uniref:Snakin-2 n=2 Tax=Arachis TaxID=3817 RepID=A0A445BRG6_ARAHY|nr:snakin-2 isoform X1 [Arachis duranensis]XP_025616274.1 snakin-2 isoform X1 [Arachis hypogaea]XP_057727465.1 snakin-2-like isoform X1 [Arachis stenosperma]QHO29389.1 uncharacterized protein DS421_8g224720 [Arachis hypogaea]RYR41248.1 hypothetical protein Ahy_A08g037649 [Arachis hypogaea]